MRNRRAAAVAVALGLGVLLIASSGASAVFVTLDAVVVLDKPSYQVGDFVNATVFVINSGALTDPDSVTIRVTSGSNPSWTESVPAARVATGTYRGMFQILLNMTSLWFPDIGLQVQATLGGLSDTDFVWVSVPAQLTLRTYLSLSMYSASPGQSVSGILRVYLNGHLLDAGQVSILVWIPNGPIIETVDLPATNISVGTYGFSYTVPTSLNESMTVDFLGRATYSVGKDTFTYTDIAPLRIALKDPFILWFHQIALTAAYAGVEVWVADSLGDPISGATVTLNTLNLQTPTVPNVISLRTTTDGQGRALFNVTLNYTSPPPALSFWGDASKGAAYQSFVGTLTAPPTRNPPYTGFGLQRDNILDVFEPGEIAIVNYTALDGGVPLGTTRILYDVHTPTHLIAYGNVTTDHSGNFALRFPMSESDAAVDVSAQMPNGAWGDTSDSIPAAMRLDAHAGAFQVGGTTRVTAQLPAAGAPWFVTVTFYPYNLSEFPALQPDWSRPPDAAGIFFQPGTFVVNGSTLDLNLTLPVYLPRDRNYLFEISASSRNPNPPNGTPLPRYMLEELVYVTAAGAVSTFLLSIVVLPIAAVAVVVLILFLIQRRRGPPASLPAAPQTPSEGGGPELPGESPKG